MFVSERGTLGEFNYGQSLVCRTMRPVLDSLAMEHHTATRLDEFEFIVDRSIKQADHHASAGGADPVAASDRRQGIRQVSDLMKP